MGNEKYVQERRRKKKNKRKRREREGWNPSPPHCPRMALVNQGTRNCTLIISLFLHSRASWTGSDAAMYAY